MVNRKSHPSFPHRNADSMIHRSEYLYEKSRFQLSCSTQDEHKAKNATLKQVRRAISFYLHQSLLQAGTAQHQEKVALAYYFFLVVDGGGEKRVESPSNVVGLLMHCLRG